MSNDDFKIGHHTYKVEEKDLVKSEHNDLLFGKCDSQSKTIELSTDLKHQEFKNEVLVHELLHAAVYESSIDLGEEEEQVVDALGKTLHGFLKDNIDVLSEMYDSGEETIEVRGDVGELISKERVIH
ncbi:hypothetical protein K6L05_00185 [Salinicoccus roseus]|uniref:hypothetical protein n=1 Tax=Salinicoccus roseus TaxID=45670 RepID=UPI001CA770B0|nr:hypothetical protein [Salinicoccus roseus]MBY8908201.1 hypothetical protein [Salinicoccus roseus]